MKTREEIMNILEADALYAKVMNVHFGNGFVEYEASYDLRAAELGLGWAQYQYAMACRYGYGEEQDEEKAAFWLEKARVSLLEQDGVVLSTPEAREIYLQAKALSDAGDDAQAAELMRQAAEAGVTDAQYTYARFCQRGRGVDRSEAEALKWFKRFSDAKYAEAVEGFCMSPIPHSALEALGAAAVYGNHRAQNVIYNMRIWELNFEINDVCKDNCDEERGEFYELGEEVLNYWPTGAESWFRSKAQQGYTDGFFPVNSDFGRICERWDLPYRYNCHYGDMDFCNRPYSVEDYDVYLMKSDFWLNDIKNGSEDTVPLLWNMEKPETWYETMAELGHAGLTYRLAYLLYEGKYVKSDGEKAVRLFELAAEQGSANAALRLGRECNRCGGGREWDENRFEDGMKWLVRAAELGSAAAQHDLAEYHGMYDEYAYYQQDYNCEKALKWYLLAAEQGYGLSIEKLFCRDDLGLNAEERLRWSHLTDIYMGDSFYWEGWYHIARDFYYGNGVEKNHQKSRELLTKISKLEPFTVYKNTMDMWWYNKLEKVKLDAVKSLNEWYLDTPRRLDEVRRLYISEIRIWLWRVPKRLRRADWERRYICMH